MCRQVEEKAQVKEVAIMMALACLGGALQAHTCKEAKGMDGRTRDFRARFTFPSTDRSFVRSIQQAKEGVRATRSSVGWTTATDLRRCAAYLRSADSCNLLVVRCLPPSLHIGICRLLSPSPRPSAAVVSCLVLGQNVRVYSQVGMALAAHGRGGRGGTASTQVGCCVGRWKCASSILLQRILLVYVESCAFICNEIIPSS